MRVIAIFAAFIWLLSSNCKAPTAPVEPSSSHPVATPQVQDAPESSSTSPSQPEDEPRTSVTAPGGHDFVAHAQLIYRIAACGHDGPIDPRFSRKVVKRHCLRMRRHFDRYSSRWGQRAGAFFAELRPRDLPDAVVYPFGGGDLATALVVFPDAREITTISLEAAGDPRTIDAMSGRRLGAALSIIGNKYRRLLRSAYSTTKSLQIASHSRLAGTLVFALSALSLHGQEPVSLRYFVIEDDGSLRYLDESELDAQVAAAREHKRGDYETRQYWREQISGFANMEIGFRARGSGDQAPVRIYRHIVANLDDPHLAEDSRVLSHLRAKGQVAAMTKAASYLLWLDEFSQIRDYLLQHTSWMISDSSGVPPELARQAGYEQIPYGAFEKPFFTRDPKRVAKQMIALWSSSPRRRLRFRFGYPDGAGKSHLMIMKRKK